jgi:hypothetical protein
MAGQEAMNPLPDLRPLGSEWAISAALEGIGSGVDDIGSSLVFASCASSWMSSSDSAAGHRVVRQDHDATPNTWRHYSARKLERAPTLRGKNSCLSRNSVTLNGWLGMPLHWASLGGFVVPGASAGNAVTSGVRHCASLGTQVAVTDPASMV